MILVFYGIGIILKLSQKLLIGLGPGGDFGLGGSLGPGVV